MLFLVLMEAVVAFPLCINVVEMMVDRMVQFLNKRQVQDDSLKWPIVPPPKIFFFFFFLWQINLATSPKLYLSYYLHRSRDSLSPVCDILGLYFVLVDCNPRDCNPKNCKAINQNKFSTVYVCPGTPSEVVSTLGMTSGDLGLIPG